MHIITLLCCGYYTALHYHSKYDVNLMWPPSAISAPSVHPLMVGVASRVAGAGNNRRDLRVVRGCKMCNQSARVVLVHS
jgi:hypothetical protein